MWIVIIEGIDRPIGPFSSESIAHQYMEVRAGYPEGTNYRIVKTEFPPVSGI